MKKTKKTKTAKKSPSGRTTTPVRPPVKREACPNEAATSAATDAPVPGTTSAFKAGKDL